MLAQVAAAARQILEKDLGDRKKTSEVDLEPLLGGSYTALLKAELGRRIRQVCLSHHGFDSLLLPEHVLNFSYSGLPHARFIDPVCLHQVPTAFYGMPRETLFEKSDSIDFMGWAVS